MILTFVSEAATVKTGSKEKVNSRLLARCPLSYSLLLQVLVYAELC